MDATQWCVVTLRFGSVPKEKGFEYNINEECKWVKSYHVKVGHGNCSLIL